MAIPRLSGNLIVMVSMLVIVMRCCSTCLANVISPTNEQEKRYTAAQQRDLVMVTMTYGHMVNHLMVITSAYHKHVELIIVSLKKLERTHSLTRIAMCSQLLNLKFGQLKKL